MGIRTILCVLNCLFLAWAQPLNPPDSVQRQLEALWDSGFPVAKAVYIDSIEPSKWTVIRGDAWVWAPAVQANKGRTLPAVFARLSGLEAGAPVVLGDLPRAERLLARMGYYESLGEVRLYRISGRNRMVPAFPMRDVASNRLEASLAYEANKTGWTGGLDLELRNLAGTARDLRFQAENGDALRSGSLYYKEPDVLGLLWDARLRGELYEEDSLRERSVVLEFARRVGFEWEYTVGAGLGSRDWRSSLGLNLDGRDRLPLPRDGVFGQGKMQIMGPRGGDTTTQRILLNAACGRLWSVGENWIFQLSAQGASLYPSMDYNRENLLALGGRDDFRVLRPRSVRSRSYGLAEADWQWQGMRNAALHLFVQPGLYRARQPSHGWLRSWGYGLGWEQAGGTWSLTLFYTLQQDYGPGEGLFNMSVRTFF